MTFDPALGYDPAQNSPRWSTGGPQTREQWVADMATSLTLRYLNGADMTEPEMANSYFAANGIQMPPAGTFGSAASNPNNAQDPMVYNSMVAVASKMFETRGMTLPSGGTVLSGQDAQNKFNATQNAADRSASAGNVATQEAGANSRNTATNASAERQAALRAQVDRESIASNERTAAADRTSRESIATGDRVERGREFDVSTAEDRRQFNATMVFNLFDRAVELAKAPVDWLGYQYFMQNMGIPMTYVNATSMATQLGAVPPSGPSSAGPVIGGPAALDGDGALAAQVGVQPALVPVSQAVQANPGNAQVAGMEQYTASNMLAQWVQQAGGASQLDAMVAQERATVLPQVVGDNQVIQQAVQQAKQVPPAPLAAAQQQMPGIPDTGVQQPPAVATGQQIGYGADQQLNQVQVPPAPAIPGDGTTMPPVPGTAPQSITTGGNTGTDRGVFTGATQTTPAPGATSAFGMPMTGTGTTNPQGDQMLQALSDQLGIPFEQLKQIVPTGLLAGGYSLDTIKNSPVIQALQNPNGPGLNFYRTAAVDGSKFGDIQAFGVPLGIRGGQDVNAQTYLQAPQASQQMMEGAIKATGQSWPDVQAQMFRSSPLTNYTPGAFGKRRFA
jgi:hypothetical protein